MSMNISAEHPGCEYITDNVAKDILVHFKKTI